MLLQNELPGSPFWPCNPSGSPFPAFPSPSHKEVQVYLAQVMLLHLYFLEPFINLPHVPVFDLVGI